MEVIGKASFILIGMIGGMVWWVPLIAALVWSSYRQKPVPTIVRILLQFSVAAAFVAMFSGHLALMGVILCPPLVFSFVNFAMERMLDQQEILSAFHWGAMLTGGLVLVALLVFTRKGDSIRKNLSLLIVLCTAWGGGLIAANTVAQSQIHRRADDLGAVCVRTRSFAAAISKAGVRYGNSPHATAIIDRKLHNWSYRLKDFYPRDEMQSRLIKCPSGFD